VSRAFFGSFHPNICFRCVGVWVNDRVEIITNDQGNRTTPSYVAFSGDVRLVGELANERVALNPQNMYVIIFSYLICYSDDSQVSSTQSDSLARSLMILRFNPILSTTLSKSSTSQANPTSV